MSAPRPRPVTASIVHNSPAAKPPTFRPRKNVSLVSSSSGSTESLIECVDDFEDVSISPCDDKPENGDSRSESTSKKIIAIGASTNTSPAKENKTSLASRSTGSRTRAGTSRSRRSVSSKSPLVSLSTDTNTASSNPREPQLSAWEKWMSVKTEDYVKRALKISEQKKQIIQERKEEEKEKREKQKKIEEDRKEWLEKKHKEQEKAERRKLLIEKKKKREEEERQAKIAASAEKIYSKWLVKKKEDEEKKREQEMEEQKLKTLALEEKQKQSDEAFKRWLNSISNRPKISNQSYAKCDGGVTGYYDSTASPSPSYYNPVPWQPVCTALPTKPEKKKSRRRKINVWAIDS